MLIQYFLPNIFLAFFILLHFKIYSFNSKTYIIRWNKRKKSCTTPLRKNQKNICIYIREKYNEFPNKNVKGCLS